MKERVKKMTIQRRDEEKEKKHLQVNYIIYKFGHVIFNYRMQIVSKQPQINKMSLK